MRTSRNSPIINTGERFNNLTVLSYAGEDYYHNSKLTPRKFWLCQCDCGGLKVVCGYNLITELTRSCGCLRKQANVTHGHSIVGRRALGYHTYVAMKSRCYNKKAPSYKYYGGRGIKICKRWLQSFENFISDMGIRPSPKHSIDRVDNNKDYTPKNCRWATAKEQAQNRRKRIIIEKA